MGSVNESSITIGVLGSLLLHGALFAGIGSMKFSDQMEEKPAIQLKVRVIDLGEMVIEAPKRPIERNQSTTEI